MKTFPCPACGAPVKFTSGVAISQVCPYCQSLLIRTDLGAEYAGEKAKLIDDASPFQIGTEGKWNGVTFTLLGRLRFGWAKGFWDEWFAWSDDGAKNWLADAQGFLSYFQEQEVVDLGQDPPANWKPGDRKTIANRIWSVKDIKSVHLIGAMGELPVIAREGRKSLSIDLEGEGSTCATVEVSPDGARVFTGHTRDFEVFKFQHLRELDGW